ncbi:MAG: LuxR C-terminal-related transcriptional regulator, partial [Octadecabacter sp.]
TIPEFDADGIVDQLYDIALEPEALDAFIDAWVAGGLDSRSAREAIDRIDKFDQEFQTHLNRADTFLARRGDGDTQPDIGATLAPFESLAAFIISKDLTVVACNDGAKLAFLAEIGTSLDALQLPPDAKTVLTDGPTDIFAKDGGTLRLLHLDTPTKTGPALFQIRKITGGRHKEANVALVISTRYHWQGVIGKILEKVFRLTHAEQGVVRGLVEGMDAKTIATDRGTSEGTVRGQIKSLMSKMNARTQSEVIRLVLSLRDFSDGANVSAALETAPPLHATDNWIKSEVWKPFNTLILPGGRKMDYHEMGPVTGRPVLYSHMGYCQARWHDRMIKLAYRHSLRVICPIRAGYGQSDNLSPKANVLDATRNDTLFLLAHLGIKRLPYLTQGNDLIFAVDLATKNSDVVSEIIGLAARPNLPGDRHYSGMGKWHRFFLSTAKHAPHLLRFTAKAAVSMAKRIGVAEMFRQMNKGSPSDMALLLDAGMSQVLVANAELIAGQTTDVSQAFAMELMETEADWSDLMIRAKATKTWFVNGTEDPATDIATISEFRETYPWINIEVFPNAGQLLLFQHYETLIPRIAEAARNA